MVFKYERYPISTIGVVVWTMTTKIARFGFKAKAHSNKVSNSFGQVYELLHTKISTTLSFTSQEFTRIGAHNGESLSNFAASPFMLVEGDNNLDTVKVQANMETENSGGEFNADNSSKLNTPLITQVMLLVMSLAC